MKLSEFLNGKDLFTELGNKGAFPFINDNEQLLNSMLLLNYGEREMFNPLSDLDVVTTADLLALEFSKVWEAYIQEEELLNQLHSEKETTSTRDNTLNRNGTRGETEKVSAYDSENLLTNGGTDSTNNEDETNLEEFTSKTVDKDLIKAYNILNEYGRKTVTKKVLLDVSDFLTIDIY